MSASRPSPRRSCSTASKSPHAQRATRRLAAFLPYLQILDFPAEAASHYAEIRADLKRRGTPIGGNDLLLAAHARSLGLKLVTNNTQEFARVQGLEIENWALAAE
jgi:tRNA(fMet)-specific endonuclease VapC